MRTINAFAVVGFFGFCFANVAEVKGQQRGKTNQKGTAPVGAARIAAPRAAAAPRVGAGGAVRVNQKNVNPYGVYANNPARIFNTGNIYTNNAPSSSGYNGFGYSSGYGSGYGSGSNSSSYGSAYNSGYNTNFNFGQNGIDFLTPAPYIGPDGAGYFFPGLINPYGIYNYGPGYNYGYNTYGLGRLNNSAANLNLKLNFYPPGTGTGLILGVASVPLDSPRVPSGPVEVADGKATVQIVAPTADAEVMLDDFTTKGTGLERSFKTPVLELGYRYGYSVTAVWIKDGEQLRETRNVEVFPGRVTLVDFSRPADPDVAAVMPDKSGPADR